MGQVEKCERRLSKCQPRTTQLRRPGGVTATDDGDCVLGHRNGSRHRREAAINRDGKEMRQSTDEGRRPMTLDAAEERGIRQPAISATERATATATDGKHWVAGGIASGGGGNGILRWRITQQWENCNFSDYLFIGEYNTQYLKKEQSETAVYSEKY